MNYKNCVHFPSQKKPFTCKLFGNKSPNNDCYDPTPTNAPFVDEVVLAVLG
jgi:hypothetical protein